MNQTNYLRTADWLSNWMLYNFRKEGDKIYGESVYRAA